MRSIFSRTRRPPWTTRRSSQPARPAIASHERRAAQHQLAGPGDHLGERVRVSRRCPARRAARRHRCRARSAVRERHVQAAARGIDAQVLPEVDRAAARCRSRPIAQAPCASVDAVEVQQQPADRVGRATAVVEQLGAVGVARLVHVLHEGVEQVGRAAARVGDGVPLRGRAARRPPASAAKAAARPRPPSGRLGRRPGRRADHRGCASPSSAMSSAVRAKR